MGLGINLGLWVRGVYSIAAETLVKVRDPNAPSPVYALCRARRFVGIREVDAAENLRLQTYTGPLTIRILN